MKQERGLATRCDTLALTDRAETGLRAIIPWLDHLLSRRALATTLADPKERT